LATQVASSDSDTLRSTALTNPATGEPSVPRTRSTVAATAACAGILVRSN
jgi:hypothetical protein